jgi:hypothetical protein
LGKETVVGRVRSVLQRGGLAGLAFAALRHTVYCQVDLIEKDLADDPGAESSDAHFEVTRLSRENAGAYSRYRPDTSPEEVVRRLERGSLCYVGWDRGRIISAAWYHPGEAWIEDLDRRFELPTDVVYAFDGHTSPELRGHRISAARASATWKELEEQGFRKGIAFVLAGNRSGDRARLRSGWRRFGRAGYARLGPWRIDFIRTRGGPTRWRWRRHRSEAVRRNELPPREPAGILLGEALEAAGRSE